MGMLSGIVHLLMLKYGIRIWFEWIDSDSNPADGLSRDGCLDVWTLTQGWEFCECPSLRWTDLQAVILPADDIGDIWQAHPDIGKDAF